MLLPFLLSVIILYYAPLDPAQGAMPWPATVVGVVVLALANAAFAWAASGLAIRLARLGRTRGRLTAGRIRSLLNGATVGFVLADVFLLKWPGFVARLFPDPTWAIVIDDFVLLLPALVMVLTVMAFWYRYAAYQGSVSLPLRRYLWLRFRVEMGILVVPWLLLVLVTDIVDAAFYDTRYMDLAGGIASAAVLVALVVFSPLLIRVIWESSPLPDGPLRRRLEAFCRQSGFRCRDILLWHTHNHLSNAGVVGPTPLVRYVMLTDALVGNCTEEETEAIFAHEVGHIKHHHLAFYMVLAVAFVCFYINLIDVMGIAGWLEPLRQSVVTLEMTTAQGTVMLVFAGVYWVLIFGYISRRMELQADLFALHALEDPTSMMSALRKLGIMSGASRKMTFWRHFGIEKRLRFLQRVLDDPSYGTRFQTMIAVLKGVMVALFVTSVARLVLWRPELLGL